MGAHQDRHRKMHPAAQGGAGDGCARARAAVRTRVGAEARHAPRHSHPLGGVGEVQRRRTG